MKHYGFYKRLLPVVAFLFFVISVVSIIDKRVHIRAQEEHKQRVREESIMLRDQWHGLQLEYATLTGYNQLHQHALDLGMVSPLLEQGNFLYLSEDEK